MVGGGLKTVRARIFGTLNGEVSNFEAVGTEVGIPYRGNRVLSPHKMWSVLDIGIKSIFSKGPEGFVSNKSGSVGQERDPSCSLVSLGCNPLDSLFDRFELQYLGMMSSDEVVEGKEVLVSRLVERVSELLGVVPIYNSLKD